MSESQLKSRREVIRYGLCAAAAASCSPVQAETKAHSLTADGAMHGQAGSFSVDLEHGTIRKASDGFGGEHQHTSEVVVENTAGRSRIRFRTESGYSTHIARTDGYLTEAEPSPDGSQVAFIEQDGDVQRLIISRVGRGDRIVRLESESTSLMRGLSWSPCGRYLALVRFDWVSTHEHSGYPAPNSYRVDILDGRSRVTRCHGAAWLGNIRWVS